MKQETRIPIHSMIDLITNSSTEIFVHSEHSVEPAKELLNEFLKLNGETRTYEDAFDISIEKDTEDAIEQWLDYYCKEDDPKLYKELNLNKCKDWESKRRIAKSLADEINAGKREMPEYVEEYGYQTFLVIKSKDKKYEKFAKILKEFLYSPYYFEHSND